MGTLFVDNIKHESAQGSGTITLGASGETVSFASGVTGLNYPAFDAYITSQQNISSATVTKASFDNEVLDTDNCYDNTTNYRFTPNVSGKYLIYLSLGTNSNTTSNLNYTYGMIYKNGSEVTKSHYNFTNSDAFYSTNSVSVIVDLNGTSDYVEAYGEININSGTPSFQSGAFSRFGGFRIGT